LNRTKRGEIEAETGSAFLPEGGGGQDSLEGRGKKNIVKEKGSLWSRDQSLWQEEEGGRTALQKSAEKIALGKKLGGSPK